MTDRLRLMIRWAVDHPEQPLLVLITVLAAAWVAVNVGVLGEIPQGHFSKNINRVVELDYSAGLFWWIVLAVGLWLFGGEDRNHLLVAWSAKFFVLFLAMLFYEYKYRYNLDAFGYFNTVLTGHHEMFSGVDWYKESWVPSPTKAVVSEHEDLMQSAGTENMIKIVLVISQLTGPFYHALKVAFAFFGLLGAWFTYRAVVVILGRPLVPALYLLMLYPSILFWSSILGKDPVFLLFIGIYAYGGALWLGRGSLAGGAWLVFAIAGSYMMRPWMAAIELVSVLVATLVRMFGFRPVLVAGVLVVPALLLGTGLGESLKFMEAGVLIEELATKVEGQASQTGSSADMDFAEAQALLQSPFGLVLILFSGLFRPLPFDATNLLVAIAALENSILLIMAMAALRHLRLARLEHPVLIWAFTYALTWSLVYGLVVLANFGAGMRYKMQVLPFMLLILFLLLNREGRAMLDQTHTGPADLTTEPLSLPGGPPLGPRA